MILQQLCLTNLDLEEWKVSYGEANVLRHIGSDFSQAKYFHKLMISVFRIPSRVNGNKPLKTMNRNEINQLFSAILLFHISVIVLLPRTSNVNFFIINSAGKLSWVVMICHLHLTDTSASV